jgi:N-acetyl-anhydromuramyl-L-alanine amidase AmpD
MATWVGYPASYSKGRARPVQYIVIHTTEGPEGATSAEAGAAYDKRRTDGTSTHLFVDADSALQEVPYTDRAHAARFHGNEIGVQVEICGTARQTAAQWDDAVSRATLARAAAEVAEICRVYALPVRRLTVAQVRSAYYAPAGARPKGICGHHDVTRAYPEDGGSHTDPGAAFPWDEFLSMVDAEMEDDVDAVDVWNVTYGKDQNKRSTGVILQESRGAAVRSEAAIAALTAKVDSLLALVSQLAGGSVDAQAVLAGVDERLAQFEKRVRAVVDEELDEQSRAGADAD